jgi:hypothetical protein
MAGGVPALSTYHAKSVVFQLPEPPLGEFQKYSVAWAPNEEKSKTITANDKLK